MTHILIPREPSAALLRPFIGCNTQELHEAWAAMVRIAEVQHARDGRSCLAQIKEPAGAAPAAVAGPAVDRSATLAAIDDLSEPSWTGYECPNTWADGLSAARAVVQSAPAAPALEAPAALLTKPALVGGGRFGVGVPERYVIEAAQRHHAQEGQREAMTAEQFADEERKRRTLWELIHGPLAAAPQAPRLGEVALHLLRRLLSNQHTLTGPEFRAELEKIVAEESARHAAAPQAPAAPSPYSADLLAALGQWHQRCEVMGAHHTLTEAQIAELVVAGLLRRAHGGQVITTAGRAALAAPAAPAVDAETIHLQDLKNALAECAALRQQLTLMDEQQAGTVWRWQADGQDQLASMGNRMGVLIYACDLRALLAGTAPAVDASDTDLLDAMQRHRIALVPEHEGPWDAELYEEGEEPQHIGSGATPREALRAALAAQTKEGGA